MTLIVGIKANLVCPLTHLCRDQMIIYRLINSGMQVSVFIALCLQHGIYSAGSNDVGKGSNHSLG